MRFKLVLSVKSESFGSVLPVSYQYELSAAVYRRIRENFELYLHWLSSNGFAPIDDCRNRLFSFSNLYIPRIRVEYDRLHILVKRVQMWISFLPVRGTHEFVKQLFSGETFVLGDRRSRVELEVEDIVWRGSRVFGFISNRVYGGSPQSEHGICRARLSRVCRLFLSLGAGKI